MLVSLTSLGNSKTLLQGKATMFLTCWESGLLGSVFRPWHQLTIYIYSCQSVSFPGEQNRSAIKTPLLSSNRFKADWFWKFKILKVEPCQLKYLSVDYTERTIKATLLIPEPVTSCHFSGCLLLVLWNCSLFLTVKYPKKNVTRPIWCGKIRYSKIRKK